MTVDEIMELIVSLIFLLLILGGGFWMIIQDNKKARLRLERLARMPIQVLSSVEGLLPGELVKEGFTLWYQQASPLTLAIEWGEEFEGPGDYKRKLRVQVNFGERVIVDNSYAWVENVVKAIKSAMSAITEDEFHQLVIDHDDKVVDLNQSRRMSDTEGDSFGNQKQKNRR